MQILNNMEIKSCYKFADEAWNKRSQSIRQFGTKEERTRESFIADQISGKLAEVIFKKQVESKFKKVSVQLDFRHYLDTLQTDEGDVTITIDNDPYPLRLDIKGSSNLAQWLLIEEHKFKDLQTDTPMSDRYVMVKFSSNMPTSKELRNDPTKILNLQCISGEIIGWANHSDFISKEDNAPWFMFKKGSRLISSKVLPGTANNLNDLRHLNNYIKKVQVSKGLKDIHIGPRLDAKINVGLPVNWLNKELEMLLNY